MGKLKNKIGKKDLGVFLALFIFTFTQFVEINIVDIENFQISAQKVAAFIFFPISILLIKKIYFNRHILLLFLSIFIAYSFYHIINLDFNLLLQITITLFTGFLSTIVIYTALNCKEDSLITLAKIWIFFSVITSIICILQAMNILPLLAISKSEQMLASSDGILRGSGLKEDPNFQSFVLNIGLVFSLTTTKKIKIFYPILIVFGIIATFSRMGLLLTLLTIFLFVILNHNNNITFKGIIKGSYKALVIIGFISFILYLTLPNEITIFIDNRFKDLGKGIEILFESNSLHLLSSGIKITSGEQRALLLIAGLIKISESIFTGVGAFKTGDAIGEIIGIKMVSHNTYIELILIGGVWSLIFLSIYFNLITKAIRKTRLNYLNNKIKFHPSFLFLFMISFSFACLFLSFTYNTILWLPAIIALYFNKINSNI